VRFIVQKKKVIHVDPGIEKTVCGILIGLFLWMLFTGEWIAPIIIALIVLSFGHLFEIERRKRKSDAKNLPIDLGIYGVKELTAIFNKDWPCHCDGWCDCPVTINENTVRELLKSGKLKGEKVSGKWVVSDKSLMEFFGDSESNYEERKIKWKKLNVLDV